MREDYGQLYEALYHQHWWWRAREAIVLGELRRLPLPRTGRVMDVGCGNGLFLPQLAAWGDVYGLEVDRSLLTDDAPHRERIYTEPLEHERYDDMRGSFDLVTALDVIEHVEDDRGFVQRMTSLLKPGGHMLVTVPAFACLWDKHDEINRHYRRYDRESLRTTFPSDGELLRVRYLFPSLFAPKWLVAQLNRRRTQKIDQARVPAAWSSALASRWLRLEDGIHRAVNLPVGTSVLAVYRKAG